MDRVIALVHSPLTGSSVWRRAARELERRGETVVVPSLAGASEGGWRSVVAAARASLVNDAPVTIAGHSNSGLLLPSIADGLSDARLLFVDAGIPPGNGVVPLADTEFLTFVRGLAKDGRLPPWSRWWGEGAMREVVPDEAARREIEADMPTVPLAYLEGAAEAPPGWERRRCAYLRFSEPYLVAENEARARGWPTAVVRGSHLQMVVDPVAVADAIIRLA